jgi:hypothetical protein
MKRKHTTIITSAPIIIHWMDVGRTSSNCNKEWSLPLQGQLLNTLSSRWLGASESVTLLVAAPRIWHSSNCSKTDSCKFLFPIHLIIKVVISLSLQFYSKTVKSYLACLHLTIYACTQLYNLQLINYQFCNFSVIFYVSVNMDI